MKTPEAKAFVDKLAADKQAFVDAGKRTGDWAGIERLVTEELYPDQSHFIYELLQNAEDAGAKEVHFALHPERLSVWHDGQRSFTDLDVQGITSIGQTQKRDDLNQIGKFGIGFKSVFAYTESPRVHSGTFHFEIRDLVVPCWVEPQDDLNKKFTYFHFPFNRRRKTQRTCFREIADGLDRLPDSTILFLKNISVLTWKASGKHDAWIKRRPEPDLLDTHGNSSVFSIKRRDSSGNAVTSRWLRFSAPIPSKPELTCSIAYALGTPPKKDADAEADEPSRRKEARLSIQPLPSAGHLHIYFPAGKEPTGLLFHIHAPFAATVDRASIPFTHPDNQFLVKELARLCADSLEHIKTLGLLQAQFLAVLPNEKDDLQEFYHPIRDEIVGVFKAKPLLPTHYGGFSKATDVVFGPKELRGFFTDDDLRFLMQKTDAVWCLGFRNSSRPDFFLDTLEVQAIDWDEFLDFWIEAFCPDPASPQRKAKAESWLKGMLDRGTEQIGWLLSFYKLLLKADKETRVGSWASPHRALRETPLVWTEHETFDLGSRVFFSGKSVSIPGVSVQMIHPSLLDFPKGTSEKLKEIRSALEVLGVTDFDEESAIEAFVEKIRSQKKIHIADHLEQLRCLMAWHIGKRITDYTPLHETNLLLDGETKHYFMPGSFYLDSPFRNTGLSVFFMGSSDAHALWPDYLEHFPEDTFASFAEAVGVHVNIPIVQSDVRWSHPESSHLLVGWSGTRQTGTGSDVDWRIEGLGEMLNRNDAAANATLWNALCAAEGIVFFAKYCPNARYTPKVGSSTLVHDLRHVPWVLSKEGALCLPCDVNAGTIAEGWRTDASNGWLAAIEFGKNAEIERRAQIERKSAAEALGISTELAEEIASLSGDEQDKWLHTIRTAKIGSQFPSGSTGDAAARAKKAEEIARESEEVEREVRKRRIRTSGVRKETRIYLVEKYAQDGFLYCQMSHAPMPFELPDGRAYFEAVELFPLEKEIPANHLCLSPTCAAEVQYALATSEDELRKRVMSAEPDSGNPSILIEVPLAEHCKVLFVQKHLIDLQAALRSVGVIEDHAGVPGNGSDELIQEVRRLLRSKKVHDVKEMLRKRGTPSVNRLIQQAIQNQAS